MKEYLPDFFTNNLVMGDKTFPITVLDFLLKFCLPFLITVFLYFYFTHKTKKQIYKINFKNSSTGKLIYKFLKLIYLLIFLVLFWIITAYTLNMPIKGHLQIIYDLFNTPFIATGSINISVLTIILAVPIFVISSLLGKFISSMVKKSCDEKTHINESYRFRMEKIAQYGTTIVLMFIGFTLLGINFSSIAVILGAFGIGIGFGLQTVISNISAGLVIFFTSPIREGDRITVGGEEGYVTKINTISTIVTTLMEETIIVPNSQLISDRIFNHTYNGNEICIENFARVDYDCDIDKVIKVLKDTILRLPYIIPGKEPDVRVSEFKESCILMVIYTDITDIKYKGKAKAWINLEILRAFRENDIQMVPVSRTDVRMLNR